MKKNIVLPNLRIDSELKKKIDDALNLLKANKEYLEIDLSQFRRMALKDFSEKLLLEGLELKFEP